MPRMTGEAARTTTTIATRLINPTIQPFPDDVVKGFSALWVIRTGK
jgi:hypothetical protein